jgi:hypothetical protein
MEVSICGLFAYGLLGILFFPIVTVGLMSLFILMCFSSLAYFVKCFQSSIKGFASLQMIFGLLFATELVTELATLIHSSRSTEFNGIWIFRARIVLFGYSSLLGMITSWKYVSDYIDSKRVIAEANEIQRNNWTFCLFGNNMVFIAIVFHVKAFFFALSSVRDWGKTKSKSAFVNLEAVAEEIDNDEKSLQEQKVVMMVEFLLFLFPSAVFSLAELFLVNQINELPLGISMALAVVSIIHFAQFFAIHSGNFKLGNQNLYYSALGNSE